MNETILPVSATRADPCR